MNVPEVFDELCEYGIALGMRDICKLPGCWELQIDDHWWIACNGHGESVKCSRGASVLPFSFYVEFNGWPAGTINAGGGIIAAGSLANEDTLIAAIRLARKAVA